MVLFLRQTPGCVIFGQSPEAMILSCPQCETRYRSEMANFPAAGRKVRCAKCRHVWHQLAPKPDVAPPNAPALNSASEPPQTVSAVRAMLRAHPASEKRASSRPLAERLGLAAGWVGLAAMIVLIGWEGLQFRQEIASVWPRSSSLYTSFGVAVNPNGIELDDVNYRRVAENGQSVLSISGTLVNNSAREQRIPPVRITLTDDDQRELYNWSYRPPQPTLRPGERLKFLTRLAGAPSTRHLQLHLASEE